MNWFKKAQQKNILDGLSPSQAKKMINRIIPHDKIKGTFSDDYWLAPNLIFTAFNTAGLDWSIISADYKNDSAGNPIQKRWEISVKYLTKSGEESEILFPIIASGAGTVENPMSQYDVIAYAL